VLERTPPDKEKEVPDAGISIVRPVHLLRLSRQRTATRLIATTDALSSWNQPINQDTCWLPNEHARLCGLDAEWPPPHCVLLIGYGGCFALLASLRGGESLPC